MSIVVSLNSGVSTAMRARGAMLKDKGRDNGRPRRIRMVKRKIWALERQRKVNEAEWKGTG